SHHHPLWLDSTGSLRDDAYHYSRAQFFRARGAGYNQRRRSVVNSRSIASRDGAIFLEGRLQRAQDFDGRVLARPFVLVKNYGWLPLLLGRDFDRNNLRLEATFLLGGDRLPMRVDGELVLLLARDAIFFSDVLTGQSHVIVVVNVPQSIVHHGIDQLPVAQPISLASIRQKIGRVRHRLHAPGDDDGTVSRLDGLRRECDRLQSRAAHLVNCHGTYFGCKSAEQRCLPSRVLTESGRDDVAHDALVDLRRLQIRSLDGFAHCDRADLRSRHIAQTSLKFSDRRAASRDDHNSIRTGHG